MQAHLDGKKVECKANYAGSWHVNKTYRWNWECCDYRIAPEPKLRPWKPEEVPVGALIKYERTVAVLSYRTKSVFGFVIYLDNGVVDGRGWGYSEVYDLISHSIDGGKTWLPCGIME
mgnify:FL=1